MNKENTNSGELPLSAEEQLSYFNWNELLGRMLNDTQWAEELLQAFMEDIKKQIPEMINAAEQNDLERIRKLAHRIKGGCANAASQVLANTAALIERDAQSGNSEGAAYHIRLFEQQLSIFIDVAHPPS